MCIYSKFIFFIHNVILILRFFVLLVIIISIIEYGHVTYQNDQLDA